MFFQINITPKQKQAAEPATKAKVNNNYNLLLAPFQPPTRINLDTYLSSSVECELTIRNSNNRHLTVSVTKVPPEDRYINLSATEWSIQPESCVILKIKWEPKEEGSWRDVLQLSDSRRIKYDVSLILNSTNPNKGIKKNKGLQRISNKSNLISKANNVLSNKMKLCGKSVLNDNKQATSKIKIQSLTKRSRTTSIEVTNKENMSQNVGLDWMLNQAQTKRQRKEQSPPTTLDFSKFLDSSTFKFTPLKSKFPHLESSLNQNSFQITPQRNESITNSDETKTKTVLRKETYITVPKFLNVPNEENENGINNEFDDSLSPKLTKVKNQRLHSEMSILLDDIKFTPFKSDNAKQNDKSFSPKYCSTSQKSIKSSSDDSVDKSLNKNATFEIDSATSVQQNNTYELTTSPTSMRNSSHLKPLCLAKEFDKNNLEIEFSTPLPVGNTKDNLMSDRPRYSNQFSKSQVDCGSAKDCLEADLWVKCKNTSLSPISKSPLHSSLKSIREEDGQPIRNIVENSKKPNAMCIEISPPKKIGNFKLFERKISPSKVASGRVVKEKPAVRVFNLKKKINNTSIRGDKLLIPGVKIAKLSLAKQLSSAKKDDSLLKNSKKKEASVKLHDPNDFLTMFCNPDPFAATMTQDPFLTSTLYYDDKWIFIQELEFKKWLNALLTPPEHLSADVESTVIDVGKVWQCCRAKETVVLAESKESVSARYHTNTRLNTLRKAACAMFRKAEVIGPLSQTTVGIEKEILLIRPDKDLHRDIGLQKTILELFISYNPLWLRIGLETVYGETIPLQSNNDLVGLSRFLLHRFFSDPFIVKHHSASSHPNIRLATFQPLMNKFMLKKFLFVVYFLDYAKRMKLIGHDPCLFHKKALIKDSRSILLTFSRELLSGIGDVTKVLRQYGYTVSHTQTYLDEYDYALTNLCTDLRDGVRLCRLMELITGKRNLTCRCRVPAISRLQKVHNVSVALSALAQAGYSLAGGIEPKCIADGHREKTLSLLWQIIYRFQRPRFERAASTVQRWWRAKLWLPRLRRLLARRRDDAARTIQRAWRQKRARRVLADQLRRRREAAHILQHRWRLWMRTRCERRDFLLRRAAALQLQAWWRRLHQTRPHVRELARCRHHIVLLQRRWRATLERRRFLSLRRCVALLQAHWRATLLGRRQRNDYLRLRHYALVVQERWRALRESRLQRQRFLSLQRACTAVQAAWRGRRTREYLAQMHWAVRLVERRRETTLLGRRLRVDYLRLRHCALVVQVRWRALCESRLQRQRFLSLRRACLTVQATWRGRQARERLAWIRWAVRLVERRREATLFGRRQCRHYLELRRCTLAVQVRWRALREGRLQRQRFLDLRRGCLAVQAAWRGRRFRECLVQLRWAVRLVEQHREAVLAGRRARQDYLELRRAALTLQRHWRALKARRRCHEAATRIQACWRGWRARRRLQALRRACRLVQARWRFARLRRAASVVQVRWRARHQRRLYLAQRAAATLLQRRWRRLMQERRLALLRWAVHLVERRREAVLVGQHARQNYLRLRRAALKLQWHWRARRRERAAVKLQSWWRSLLLGRHARDEFRALKAAVLLIENWWIGSEERRARRAHALRRFAAVLKIQAAWRVRARRRAAAAIKIQAVWKGMIVRRAASQQLAELRSRAEQAAKDAVPTATVAFRLEDNIEKFKYAANIGQLSISLASLDVLVRLLPNACIQVCQLNLVSKLYDILMQANRSLPWLDVCLKDVSILLTLAKFKPTTEYVLKLENVHVLARLLTISSDKKEDLFLHTATLLWVLMDNHEYAEAAKNCPRTKYLFQSLYTSLNKKLGKSASTVTRCVSDELPSPNPDWGLRNKRPRTFNNVSLAIMSLASRLNILNIAQAVELQRSFNFSI
ncbi:protein abnormal spindle [Phymastichus coffea]|uniref:protein abnormal spindle n=1 Tax=Phymastichus coffea TaxID=108790 RepID=UPI00273CEA24|nr:protein abnormal spindle [Phymastichus coffea]